MAKRRANAELNHDNWDKEEEIEDPGTFQPVTPTELQTRVFAKAKRSLGASNSPIGTSPFAGFSGFSSSGSTNPFNFLKNSNDSFAKNVSESKSSEKNENGKQQEMEMESTNTNQSSSAKNIFGNKTFGIESKPMERKENGSPPVVDKKNTEVTVANPSTSTKTAKEKPTRNIEYYRQLQSLNEGLLKWVQQYFFKNSCYDFTPVFNDYKKHIETLNLTYPIKSEALSSKEGSDSVFKKVAKDMSAVSEDSSNGSGKSCFKLTNYNNDETDYGVHFSSNTTNTSTVSFGHKTIPSPTTSFTKGPNTSTKVEPVEEKKSPYQFFGLKTPQFPTQSTMNKPFSFASSLAEKSSATENDEAAEYVPPKNDFTAVSEDDAIYSKRCKLFFKKDENFVDKGVGTLYLKPLDGKTQLLVRADTNLGNILLNIMLSASLPTSRTGKNNVLLVCVPNPPLDAKNPDSKEAIPILIRVKTSEDADQLLEVLDENKT